VCGQRDGRDYGTC